MQRPDKEGSFASTRVLLVCGIISAPLFYVVAVAQMFTRQGFDIRTMLISLLSLGNLGWVQIASFIVTGSLAIMCAVGMRRFLRGSKGGALGPLLVGTYGAGMVLAGVFHPDPSLGFPPGAPAGMPATMSGHAVVHTFAFYLAFLSLIVGCIVFARRFVSLKQTGWGIYCLATAVFAPLLIVVGSAITSWVGVLIAFAGVVAFGWVSAISARLMAELSKA